MNSARFSKTARAFACTIFRIWWRLPIPVWMIKAFYQALFSLMQTNMKRLEEEVTWFTEKYDYRNKDKDWGNSRDSVQRCMQKDRGGYPADPVFTSDR